MSRAGSIHDGIPQSNDPAAARIAQVASRQYRVISTPQLLACGLNQSTITDWVRAGHLHRIRRGVYAVGTANIDRNGSYMAAVLAGGGGAALAMTSAARHLTLDRSRATGTIHLVLPRDNRRSPRGILVHRPTELPAGDLLVLSRIRTTSATRTLYDLAPSISANELRSRFERAEFLEKLDRPRLRELIRTSTNHKGIANLRVLAEYAPLPLSRIRSQLEGTILSACRTHSLPIPLVNVQLLGYEVDFLWPEARFVVEADGGQHKGEQRERDNLRDLSLVRAGYLVRRYGETAAKDVRAVAVEMLVILGERLPRSA